jgi:8-oxo-dGTP pyrophosphatase MutT (NUDIX family)
MEERREHQQFHAGLKAFIAQGDKLLILQDEEGLWELPGGRTEKGCMGAV